MTDGLKQKQKGPVIGASKITEKLLYKKAIKTSPSASQRYVTRPRAKRSSSFHNDASQNIYFRIVPVNIQAAGRGILRDFDG